MESMGREGRKDSNWGEIFKGGRGEGREKWFRQNRGKQTNMAQHNMETRVGATREWQGIAQGQGRDGSGMVSEGG